MQRQTPPPRSRRPAAGTSRRSAVLNDSVSPRGVQIDDLLIHADFVRGLARDLVRDPNGADDLAQEAWVCALQTPPRHATALRGWFATLVQNLRLNIERGDRRRRAREARVEPPLATASAEQILEREQVRERLVRAVMQLDEPFRTTVLLRYYEELPTAAIARRLGVPGATVRTRLSRGIARLRELLDERHGGGRAWLAPLATWAPESTPGIAVLAAGIGMKKILFAAAAVALLSLAWAVSPPDEPPLVVPLPPAGTAAAAAAKSIEVAESTQREAGAAAAMALDAESLPVFACERGVGIVFGDVVDENDEPVAGVEVVAEPVVGALPPRFQLRDDRSGSRTARTDSAGGFRIDGITSGPIRVRTIPDDSRRAETHTTVAPGATEGPLVLRLQNADPRDRLRVTVVDGEGRPVPGAAIEVHGWSSHEAFASRATDPRIDPIARGVADADGVFELRGAAVRAAVAHARTEDAAGIAQLDSLQSGFGQYVGLRVVLAPTSSLRGTFTGEGAETLDGATVSLHAQSQCVAYHAGGGRRFDARVAGRSFRFDGLAAGHYSLTLSAPSGVRVVVKSADFDGEPMPNSARPRVVAVAAGQQNEVEIRVAAGGRLRGIVHTDGRAVAGARVRAVLAPRTSDLPASFVLRGVHVWRLDGDGEAAPNEPTTHVEGLTDGAGVYELRSLQPGSYRVEVIANGLSYDRRMDVGVDAGGITELRHDLVASGVLQLAALELDFVGVTAVGATTPAMLAIVDREFVTFPGLAPGKYEIARFDSERRVEPVVLATAEVFAGRTTWVDLRQPAAVLAGRVTSAGAPVAGATVSWRGLMSRTDAFGAFRMNLGHEPTPRWYAAPVVVSRRGVRTGFDAPLPVSEGGVFELGRRHVTIRAVDATGLPVPATLEMQALDLPNEGHAVRSCSIELALPTTVDTHIGPVPDTLLHGDVVFADGLRLPISLLPGTDSRIVARPPTGTVRVQVRNRDGTTAAGVAVDATTWGGEGEPPANDLAFLESENMRFRTGLTGEDGIAEFAVVAGEVLLSILDASVRVTVAPGATVPATLSFLQ